MTGSTQTELAWIQEGEFLLNPVASGSRDACNRQPWGRVQTIEFLMELQCESTVYQAKQSGPHFDFGVKDKIEKKKASSGGGIRCPKCRWIPRAHDRWMCHCRHVWNTFDTRGKCPGCGFQWNQTKCLACQEWSAHEAWYEKENPS